MIVNELFLIIVTESSEVWILACTHVEILGNQASKTQQTCIGDFRK